MIVSLAQPSRITSIPYSLPNLKGFQATHMMAWHYWIARNSTLLSGAVIYINRFLVCYYRLLSFLLRNSRGGFIRIFLLVIQEGWEIFFIRRGRGSFGGIFFIEGRGRRGILLIIFRIVAGICCI